MVAAQAFIEISYSNLNKIILAPMWKVGG